MATILVVEDELDVQKVVAKRLSSRGFTVECASDGYQAVQKAHKVAPDLIVLDLQLPAGDVLLSPEMRSTGEVMGLDADLGIAYAKSQMAAGGPLPPGGRLFISVNESDKKHVAGVAKQFVDLGFEIIATSGTAAVLEEAGLKVQRVFKLQEGRPNALDLLKNRELQLVINTPSGATPRADEVRIRTTAVYTGTPIITTISSAKAAVLGIAALKRQGYGVKTLQEYH